MKAIINKAEKLYKLGVIKRSIIMWIMFQIILWVVFGIAYYLNIDSWNNISEIGYLTNNSDGLFKTFFIILGNNLILFMLIAAGNIFVRFGIFTPGLLILLIQGITIGWMAGNNAFEVPFVNVMEANLRYLKVGLWETTAYALICAVTLTKSLNIAKKFPAKEWSEERNLRDLSFSVLEKRIIILGILFLIIAAIIEAYLLVM